MTKLKIARLALEEILNPVGVLKVRAEASGRQLSGQAWSICNSVAYLQEIARKAINEMDGK